MSAGKKSTDPGLSAAERKTLRSREAQEAIADHEKTQKAFAENRERLKAERLAREAKTLGLKAKHESGADLHCAGIDSACQAFRRNRREASGITFTNGETPGVKLRGK